MKKATYLVAALAACTAIAQADLTVTTTVSIPTVSAAAWYSLPAVGTYTTYHHGEYARTDLPNGTSWIFDFGMQQVATLNSGKKTYSIQSLGAFLAGGKLRASSSYSTNVSAPPNQSQKTIANLTAMNYSFTASPVLASTQQSSNATMSLRSMRRGAPMGQTAFGGRTTTPTSLVSSTGTLWMVTAAQGLNAWQFSIPQLSIAFSGNGALTSIASQVDQLNLVPVTIDFVIGQSSNGTALSIESTVMATSATTVDTNLFKIPSGYSQVASN